MKKNKEAIRTTVKTKRDAVNVSLNVNHEILFPSDLTSLKKLIKFTIFTGYQ